MAKSTRRADAAAAAAAAAVAAKREAKWAPYRRGIAVVTCIFLTLSLYVDKAWRDGERTVPRELRMADCDPYHTNHTNHFLLCYDAASHNRRVFEDILVKAKRGVMIDGKSKEWENKRGGEIMSNSISEYYVALAMRNDELFWVQKVVNDFLIYIHRSLACTQVIDLSDSQIPRYFRSPLFKLPPYLCTKAEWANLATKDIRNYDPTQLMKISQQIALLFSLFGSQYHEAAIAFSAVIPLQKGNATLPRPTFGYYATKTYRLDDPRDQWFELITMMWKSDKNTRNLLTPIVEQMVNVFNIMALKETDKTTTWNETFFKSAPPCDRTKYYFANTHLFDRIIHRMVHRMNQINSNIVLALIKVSFYITTSISLTLYIFSDFLPFHPSVIVYIFTLSVLIIGIIVRFWPNCVVLDLLKELQRRANVL